MSLKVKEKELDYNHRLLGMFERRNDDERDENRNRGNSENRSRDRREDDRGQQNENRDDRGHVLSGIQDLGRRLENIESGMKETHSEVKGARSDIKDAMTPEKGRRLDLDIDTSATPPPPSSSKRVHSRRLDIDFDLDTTPPPSKRFEREESKVESFSASSDRQEADVSLDDKDKDEESKVESLSDDVDPEEADASFDDKDKGEKSKVESLSDDVDPEEADASFDDKDKGEKSKAESLSNAVDPEEADASFDDKDKDGEKNDAPPSDESKDGEKNASPSSSKDDGSADDEAKEREIGSGMLSYLNPFSVFRSRSRARHATPMRPRRTQDDPEPLLGAGSRVKFAPENKNSYRIIPHREDYGNDVILAMWHDRDELDASQDEFEAGLANGTIPWSDPGARGFFKTDEEYKKKKQKRRKAYKKVFDEQRRQREYDADAIREAYCSDGTPADDLGLALARARKDADDAKEVLADESSSLFRDESSFQGGRDPLLQDEGGPPPPNGPPPFLSEPTFPVQSSHLFRNGPLPQDEDDPSSWQDTINPFSSLRGGPRANSTLPSQVEIQMQAESSVQAEQPTPHRGIMQERMIPTPGIGCPYVSWLII